MSAFRGRAFACLLLALVCPSFAYAQVSTKQGGTGVGNGTNVSGGVPLINGIPTSGNCLKWSSTGIQDAGGACGTGGGLTIGTSTITSGTSGRVLYDNSGVLGEATVSGTGSVVFTNSPTLVTPTLGIPASVTLTNATGLPISTGVSGLGTGVATALAAAANATGGAALVNGSPTVGNCLKWSSTGIQDASVVCGAFVPPSRTSSSSTSASSADNNGSIIMTGAGTVTLSAYSGIVTGTRIDIISTTASLVSISGASTFNSWTNLAGQYAGATCIYNSSWYCSGALAP